MSQHDDSKIATLSPPTPEGSMKYLGHNYSLVKSGSLWKAKLVVPLRPSVFEKLFETKQQADQWIKELIEGIHWV